MRNLIVCNIISLDGFYSGPGGDVMAMPFDAGFSDYNAELYGRPIRCCSGALRTSSSAPTGLLLPRT